MRLLVEGLFIKISGVTTEEDALFSIGLGASAVGFEFAPGPRQMTTPVVHDIVRRLPSSAISVGVFRHETPERVVDVANRIGLSAVQIDGAMPLEQVAWVAERVNTVLRSVGPEGADESGLARVGVDYLVLPDLDEESALVESLPALARPTPPLPMVASGGLSVENVAAVVADYPVWGVDVRAGVESEPGVKDPGRLGAFIAAARWAYENAVVDRVSDWLAP
ncbi:MAG: phosphoribosylanthranilate isomerase [Acidobacteriota bacterium]|nr:phosphoribosylanthranilate isomerase [Acidobacteriota bacterium]